MKALFAVTTAVPADPEKPESHSRRRSDSATYSLYGAARGLLGELPERATEAICESA
jgi:hypothetical protein